MKLERGRICKRELLFSVFCFMLGTAVRSGFVISITRNDSWVIAFTGLVMSLLLVSLYAALGRRFPGKSLVEMSDPIFGRMLGKVVSILYLFFFLSLAALNTRDLGNFVTGYMMPETPAAAITLPFILVCAYAVSRGIESFMRLSTLFCIMTIAAIFINFGLMLKDVQFDFLKPFFRLPLMKYVQATLTVTAIPLGEILAFTMITPMLGGRQGAGKTLALGLLFSAVSMAVLMIREVITLGPLVSVVTIPSFESVRYISVAGILTRMESLYAVILLILFLFKVVILLYAFVLGLAQLLGMTDYRHIILLSAALVYFYSMIVFQSDMENSAWGATTAPFFSLSYEFALPAVSLLTAFLRRKRSSGEVDA